MDSRFYEDFQSNSFINEIIVQLVDYPCTTYTKKKFFFISGSQLNLGIQCILRYSKMIELFSGGNLFHAVESTASFEPCDLLVIKCVVQFDFVY